MLWDCVADLKQKAGLGVQGERLGAREPEEGGVMPVRIRGKGAEAGVGAAWRALRVVQGIAVPALQGCAALQRRLLLHGLPEAVHPCMTFQPSHTYQMMRKQCPVMFYPE